ncbi:unnamed protein product [Leptosia nina]|uniref:Uncharacterized protein n=1 Tax=Leptosia nina TaxID=320188 RepID=A0AAV1JAW9_9NEOP
MVFATPSQRGHMLLDVTANVRCRSGSEGCRALPRRARGANSGGHLRLWREHPSGDIRWCEGRSLHPFCSRERAALGGREARTNSASLTSTRSPRSCV